MILGYEEPVLMPTMDIYSTDLMKMYIEGVREQYKEGLEEYKDFMKQYQDFYSPIAADNQRYYDLTIGGALKLIADAAKNGIDLFKSPEGRAMVRSYIQGVNPAEVNALRLSAANAQEWVKARNKLAAEGKYDPRMNSLMGGADISGWDTSKNGVFTDTTPFEAKSLADLTSQFYKNLEKDEFLENDESMGKYAPYYGLYGAKEGTLLIADAAALEELARTPYYNVYMLEALRDPDVATGKKTPEQALAALVRRANEPYWAQPKQKLIDMKVKEWEQGKADARTNRSIAARLNNPKPQLRLFSYIEQSLDEGLLNIINRGGSEDFRQAQRNIVKNSKKGSVLSNFTTIDDNTGFNKWMGAKNGVIDLSDGRINRLMSGEEILADIDSDDASEIKMDKNGNRIAPKRAFAPKPINKTTLKNVYYGSEDADKPKMTARGNIVTWVDRNGKIKQAKPVDVSYIGDDGKPHIIRAYYRMKESDRQLNGDNAFWVSPASYSAMDSQFSSTVGSINTKRENYADYTDVEE